MKPLAKVVAEMWPGVPVLPVMETGASDGKYTSEAGLPTYGINGIAIDINDVRAHGKDERVADRLLLPRSGVLPPLHQNVSRRQAIIGKWMAAS